MYVQVKQVGNHFKFVGRGNKVFNTIIQMEAGHLRKTHKLLNSKKHFKQSSKAAKG